MSRLFTFGLFVNIVFFFYNTTWLTYGKPLTDYARWGLLLLMCLFALSPVRRQAGEYRGSGLKAFGYAFAFIAVLSASWSLVKPIYTFGRGLSMLLLAVVLLAALWPRLRKPKDYLSVMNTLVAAAWVITIANLAVWLGGHANAARWPTGAVQGVFGNPNGLGMTYASLVPLLVARFHYRKSILSLGLLVAAAVLIVASQSRAGVLGAFLGTCGFYAGIYGRKLWAVVLVLFIAAGAGIFAKDVFMSESGESSVNAVEHAMTRGESDMSEYGSGRIPLWLLAYDKWKKRPFLGYGFGTAGDTYYRGGDVPARFHSSFVQITAELGAVGLFFFIAPIIYSGLKIMRSHLADAPDRGYRIVIAGLAGGWVGGVMDSCFESWLFSVGNVASILGWVCFFAAMKGLSSVAAQGEASTGRKLAQ